MAGETVITVVGNLTADPELRFTPSGAAVASFTIASTPRTFDKNTNEWKDGDALFLRCSIWRQAAENVAESLQRARRVARQVRRRRRPGRSPVGFRPVRPERRVQRRAPLLIHSSATRSRSE